MILTWLTVAALVLMFVKLCAELWLDKLNMGFLASRGAEVPKAFADFISLEEYRLSSSYTRDKTRLDMFEGAANFILLALLFLFGFFPLIFAELEIVFGTSIWAQALILMAVFTLLSITELPFDFYSQFIIEEKYGFNKGSVGLWVADKFKGFLIGLVLGVPLLGLLLLFFKHFENSWWLWGFGLLAVFQIVMLVAYPKVILPLFNKLEPLKEGELKDRLMAVAERGQFKARAIFVIDGSKRSSHSNAYFSGFGKFRQIVLYDTLIEQLTPVELEAVLAHEIGHYKKGHILRLIAMNFAKMFAGFALMGLLAKSAWFYEGFGFAADSGFAPLMLLFTLLSGVFSFWLTPLGNRVSRKYEYEADAFAKALCGTPEPLVSALRKLQKKNRSNLTPHPLYSAFYYSHPTILEREAALTKE